MQDQDKAVRAVSQAVNDLAAHLVAVRGLDPELVIAAMHAECMTLITVTYGGDVAATCAREAAERVAGLPAYTDTPLAAAPAAGRA